MNSLCQHHIHSLVVSYSLCIKTWSGLLFWILIFSIWIRYQCWWSQTSLQNRCCPCKKNHVIWIIFGVLIVLIMKIQSTMRYTNYDFGVCHPVISLFQKKLTWRWHYPWAYKPTSVQLTIIISHIVFSHVMTFFFKLWFPPFSIWLKCRGWWNQTPSPPKWKCHLI